MEARMEAAVRSTEAMWRERDFAAIAPFVDPDVVLDWTNSVGPYRGVYRGLAEARELFESILDAFADTVWEAHDVVRLGDRLAMSTSVTMRGGASGVETTAAGGQAWTFAGDKVSEIKMFQSGGEALRWMRHEALAQSRLYFVCDARPRGEDPGALLSAALDGGVQLVQLREKAPRCAEEMVAFSEPFRRAARDAGALFLVDDWPELVEPCGADGVHVGQDDTPVSEARAQAPPGALVGLSTHSPRQLDAACAAQRDARPDYVSVGPVWETPTKEGRPAAGLDYVRYAAEHSTLPWFAIGGIDPSSVGEVAAAGASRVAVVRAIREAESPAGVARALIEALDPAATR